MDNSHDTLRPVNANRYKSYTLDEMLALAENNLLKCNKSLKELSTTSKKVGKKTKVLNSVKALIAQKKKEYLAALEALAELKAKKEKEDLEAKNAKKVLEAKKAEKKQQQKESKRLEKEKLRREKEKRKLEKDEESKQKKEAKEQEKLVKKELKKQQKEANKVLKAKKPKYAKEDSIFKKGVKNLKISRGSATLVTFGMIAVGGFFIWKSGVIQELYSDYVTHKMLNEAMSENSASEIPKTIDIYESSTIVSNNTISENIVEEEEVVEEKHEYINTELYDEGYEFNEDITPQFLQSINPILSDSTSWLQIPGTGINYAFVSPSTSFIDEVKGLRKNIEESGLDDAVYMQQYFLHSNLKLGYSEKGTLFLDINNNKLGGHTDELTDMSAIYGHHMGDGSMFQQLMNWKNDANGKYNEQHPFGIIYTDDGYGYKVTFIASRVCSGIDSSVIHPYNFESYEEKSEYITSTIEEAHKHGWFALDDYEVQEDDKFLSLVTCSYEADNYRYQLIGKLEKIKVRDSSLTSDENGYYVEYNPNTHTLVR